MPVTRYVFATRSEKIFLAADWADLTKRLLLCARYGVGKHAPEDRRRFDVVCKSYVERIVADLDLEADVDGKRSLYRLLAAALLEAIHDDDKELDRIIDRTNWPDVVRRVLAYTSSKHGPGPTRAGKEPLDRVHEAVSILIERRHHYPHYRGVSLVAFLCMTVDGIVSHDAEKLKNQGPHVRIARSGVKAEKGEYPADRLPGIDTQTNDVIAEKRTERFLASLEPELQRYMRLRDAQPGWTAKQYAEALSTSVKQIRNWDRMLVRRRRKFERNAD